MHFNPTWVEGTTSLPFTSDGPCGTSIIVQLSEYSQEAHLIKSSSVPAVAPLAVQSQGTISVTLPGEAEQDTEAKNSITKLWLFFIGRLQFRHWHCFKCTDGYLLPLDGLSCCSRTGSLSPVLFGFNLQGDAHGT